MKRNQTLAALLTASLAWGVLVVEAADHAEAPGTAADQPADIADFYLWHEGSTLVAAITVAGLAPATSSQEGAYDDDVLYTVHLDRDADNTPDVSVNVRFGQSSNGNWGVQVENLPGTSGPVTGPVGTVIDAGNGRTVYAGLRDDPFFFDLEGFVTTLQTGTLSFQNTRDSVAGLNATAIVLEMDLNAARGSSTTLNAWATTGRK